MFICDDCLKEKFINRKSIVKSHGSCEVCKKENDCNDIQSGHFILKEESNGKEKSGV